MEIDSFLTLPQRPLGQRTECGEVVARALLCLSGSPSLRVVMGSALGEGGLSRRQPDTWTR